MDLIEFETKYTTSWKSTDGFVITLFPLNKGEIKGAIHTLSPGNKKLGDEYSLRNDNGDFYITISGKEYLFFPTENGFDLLSGATVSHSFTRLV